MEIKRALLLFAIVLGMAAIVSSIARPPGSDDTTEQAAPSPPPKRATAPSATAGPAEGIKTIEIRARPQRRSAQLHLGRPATLVVHVAEPAQVEIPSLGLVQPGEPLTPARFDILVSSPGDHEIFVRRASPAAGQEPVAKLRVVRAP